MIRQLEGALLSRKGTCTPKVLGGKANKNKWGKPKVLFKE